MDAVAPDNSRSVGACVSQFTPNKILFFVHQPDSISPDAALATPGRDPSAWLLAADLVSRDAGFAAWLAIGAVARLRLCRLVAQAGAHELLPSIAAHSNSLRHTFRVVRAGGWIDREEHT